MYNLFACISAKDLLYGVGLRLVFWTIRPGGCTLLNSSLDADDSKLSSHMPWIRDRRCKLQLNRSRHMGAKWYILPTLTHPLLSHPPPIFYPSILQNLILQFSPLTPTLTPTHSVTLHLLTYSLTLYSFTHPKRISPSLQSRTSLTTTG